ncbi:hypothetical protein MMPV_009113 [Pyropia vietnamensis]
MEHNSRGGNAAAGSNPPPSRRPAFVDVSGGGNVDVDERRSRLLARLNQIDLEKSRLTNVAALQAPSSSVPSRVAAAAGGSGGGGGRGDGVGGGTEYPAASTMNAEHSRQHSGGPSTLPTALLAAVAAAGAAAASASGAVGYQPVVSPVVSTRAMTGTVGALPSYGHHGSYDPLHRSGSGAVPPGGVDEAAARTKARSKKGAKKSRSGRAVRGSVAAGGAVGAPAFGGRQASYCSRVIKDMLRIKDASSFSKPITSIWTPEQLPGYLDIVKRPMDLGTVLQNLQDGVYHTLPPSGVASGVGVGEGTDSAAREAAGDAVAPGAGTELTPLVGAAKGFDPAAFAADVRLVFSNALAYNTPGDPFHAAATRLLARFEDKFGALPDVDAPPERRRLSGTKSATKSEPVDAASSRAWHSTRKRSAPEELSRGTRGGHEAAEVPAAKVPRRGTNGDANSGVADSRNWDAQRPLVDSSPARRASGAGRSTAPASKRAKKRRVDHRSDSGRGSKGAAVAAAVDAPVEESVMSGSAVHAVERQSVAALERELLNLRSKAAAAGDKVSIIALRDVPMTYEGKVELSINVNQLPSEQLQKLVSLVARSTSASFPVNEEQEIELDIDSLDNHTLRDMEAMIFATLLKGRKQPSKAQLTALRKEIAVVQARLEEAKVREAAEATAAPPLRPPLSGGGHAGAAGSGGPPKRRPRAPRSFLSSSSSGSGSSSSSRGSGSSSSGLSTGSSSSSGSGASGSSRRQRRALAVADKQRLAAAMTRPSPAASTTAAAAVPLYPPSGLSRMAGATLAAARSPVSEFRPGGRPPAYTKPSGGGSPGEALIGAAAAAEAPRGCPSDEEGKAVGPTSSPTFDAHQRGGAADEKALSGGIPARDDGSRLRPITRENRCRSGGGGERQPPPPTPELPGPCGGTHAAPSPPVASGRAQRVLPLRSEDEINMAVAGSGGEGRAGSGHSSEPPRTTGDKPSVAVRLARDVAAGLRRRPPVAAV